MLRGFLDCAQVGQLLETARLLRSANVGIPYFAQEGSVRRKARVERFVEAAESAGLYTGYSAAFAAALDITGLRLTPFKEKVNYRAPGSHGFAPHQDSSAGWTKYAPRFVSVGLFPEAAGNRTGGLEFVSCAHSVGLLPASQGRLDADVVAELAFEPVQLAPGDAVVIDGFTPHRSSRNCSSRPLTRFFFTFSTGPERCRDEYYADKAECFEQGAARFRLFDFATSRRD